MIMRVTMVLIMVDEEGDGCAEYKQRGENNLRSIHRKWDRHCTLSRVPCYTHELPWS
jgi:hypothetical protein